MKAYLGVDWSATRSVTAAAGEEGKPTGMSSVAPVLSDTRSLVDDVREKLGADEVHVIIEAGSPVWVNLFWAAGAVVHVVDPKQAKRFAESLGSSGAKDDRRDARFLVEMGRSPAHLPEAWAPSDKNAEKLELLGGIRERIVGDRASEIQRVRGSVRRSMPLLDEAVSSFHAKWIVRLLREAPTAWHLSQLTEEKLLELLRGAHKATASKVKDAWSRTQAPWLDEDLAEIEGMAVRQALSRLELFDRQVTELDARIEAVLNDIEKTADLLDVGGLGPGLTAILVVFGLLEPGDRDATSIRMGASPVFVGSGTTKKGAAKGKVLMRRAAAPRARQATYLLGRQATQHHRWAAAQYQEARRRGKNAATAYRQVARSFLRILRAIVRDGSTYDEDRYEMALRSRGVMREAKGARWEAA